jgi:hypothetical protein
MKTTKQILIIIEQIEKHYKFSILSHRIINNYEFIVKTSTINTRGKNINRRYKIIDNNIYELLPTIGYFKLKKIIIK